MRRVQTGIQGSNREWSWDMFDGRTDKGISVGTEQITSSMHRSSYLHSWQCALAQARYSALEDDSSLTKLPSRKLGRLSLLQLTYTALGRPSTSTDSSPMDK